jgi:DNA polymerase
MRFNEKVKRCTRCPELVANRTNVVIGSGAIPCDILFLGEAPGEAEDQEGVPFIGRAGKLLRIILQTLKIDLEKCHILNVLKCRPPSNRDPRVVEIENCRPFLEQQIKVTKPKVIVAMGRYAQAFVSGKSPSSVRVMKVLGDVVDYNGIPAILTFHPSYLSRDRRPEIERAFRMHLKKAKGIVRKKRK